MTRVSEDPLSQNTTASEEFLELGEEAGMYSTSNITVTAEEVESATWDSPEGGLMASSLCSSVNLSDAGMVDEGGPEWSVPPLGT